MHKLIKLVLVFGFFVGFFGYQIESAQAGRFKATACTASMTNNPGDGTVVGNTAGIAYTTTTCSNSGNNAMSQSTTVGAGLYRGRSISLLASGNNSRIESIKTTVSRLVRARNSVQPCVLVSVTRENNTTASQNGCLSQNGNNIFFNPALGVGPGTGDGGNFFIDIDNSDMITAFGGNGFDDMKAVTIEPRLICIAGSTCSYTSAYPARMAYSDLEVVYDNYLGNPSALSPGSTPAGFYPSPPTFSGSSSGGFNVFTSFELGSSKPNIFKCSPSCTSSAISARVVYTASAPMGIRGIVPNGDTTSAAGGTRGPLSFGDYNQSTSTGATNVCSSTNSATQGFFDKNPCSNVSTQTALLPILEQASNISPSLYNTRFNLLFQAYDVGSTENLYSEPAQIGTTSSTWYMFDSLAPSVTTPSPSSYSSTATPTKITASTNASDAAGVVSHTVERSNAFSPTGSGATCPSSPTSPSWTSIYNPTLTSYPTSNNIDIDLDVSGLNEGSCYFFKTTAKDTSGYEWKSASNNSYQFETSNTSSAFMVDKTNPTSTFSCTPASPNGSNSWYKSPLACSFGSTDNASRPADNGGRVELSTNNGSTYPTTDTVSWTTGSTGDTSRSTTYSLGADSGQTMARAYSIDRAGRQSSTTSAVGPYKIDKTNPASSSVDCPGGTSGSNSWYTAAPTCTLSGSDATSGVWKLDTSPDDSAWTTRKTVASDGTTSDSIVLATASEGTNNYYPRTTDRAGNTTTGSLTTVKLDTANPAPTAPSCSSTSLGNNGWFRADAICSASGYDLTSLPNNIQYASNANGGGYGSFTSFTSPSTSTRTNLITNPTFASATTGWSAVGSGTFTRVSGLSSGTPPSIDGTTTALRAQTTAEGQDYYTTASVTNGQSYTASAMVYVNSNSASSSGAGVRTVVTNTSNVSQTATSSSGTYSGTGSWQRVYFTFTANFTGTARIQFDTVGSATIDAYWTRVMFENTSNLRSYFDGSTTGASWSGTANASSSTTASTLMSSAAPFTFSTEGTTLLKTNGIDTAGLSAESAAATIKIDKTNPSITFVGSMPSGAIAETVTFGATTATDATSKITTIKIEYKKGAGAWTQLPSASCANQTFASLASATSSSCNFNTENLSDSSTDNDYLFRYTALDEAGNTISSSTSSPVTIKNSISLGNLSASSNVSSSAKPSGGSSVVVQQPVAQSFQVTSVPNWSLKICVPDSSDTDVLKSTTDSETFTGTPLQTQVTKIGASNTSLTQNVSKNCNTTSGWVASNRTGGTTSPISIESVFIQNLPWTVSGGKTYSLPIQYNLSTVTNLTS